ncbi:MAG: hypothetical protein R3A45_01910 [Bdellovibrionota bacterium]
MKDLRAFYVEVKPHQLTGLVHGQKFFWQFLQTWGGPWVFPDDYNIDFER